MQSGLRLAILSFLCGVVIGVTDDCTTGGITIPDTTKGSISSPPSWSRETSCLWVLRIPSGKYLKIKFTKFDLLSSQACQTSYLELTFNKTVDLKYCGQQFPPEMTFSGPNPLIIYHGIGKTNNVPGFVMEFEQVDKAVDCPLNVMKCRNNRCFDPSKRCDSKDDCGDGTDEEKCESQQPLVQTFDCGKPAIPPIPGNGDRIVGGTEAVPNSWPWQVSIQLKHVFPSGHFCGGALVNSQWVVTAGHCFEKRKAAAVRVKLGDHFNFKDEEGEIVRYVDEVFVHPSYDPEPKFDIALLKLSAPVTFTKKVAPVCLPETKEEIDVGTKVHITGFGDTLTDNGDSEVLKQVMVPIIKWELCSAYYADTVPPHTICTHQKDGGHSPCMGDSGGPLVAKNEQDQWILHGVVSWGHRMCGSSRGAAVYTQVSEFKEWLNRVIENNS